MKPGSPSQQKGASHEDAAVQLLLDQGLSIVSRNFHCKMGEIDIVALDNNLHFVEVRFRADDRFGGAAASVTYRKQQKLKRAAEFFLLGHPRFRKYRAQFDVITISGTHYPPQPVWIQSAF